MLVCVCGRSGVRASDGCLMAHTHLSDLAAAGGGKPAGDCNRMKSGRTCQQGRDGRAVGGGLGGGVG